MESEHFKLPTSPISMGIGIYDTIKGEEDKDFCLRYIFENVPHHQDQISSPQKLRDGTTWSSIILLPNNIQDSTMSTLPTIVEQNEIPEDQRMVTFRKDKGKRQVTEEFLSPPTSLRIMNVGYRTPFKSSSQFFVRPRIPLPSHEMLLQRNVLVGLGLPQTPAFENLSSLRATDPHTYPRHIQLRASNPFEGRDTPLHMVRSSIRPANNVANLPPASTNLAQIGLGLLSALGDHQEHHQMQEFHSERSYSSK